MSEIERKVRKKRRMGRPPKHGGYSIILRDELLKEHPRLRQYLEECRAGLVRDVAGSEDQLSEQQRIMIDRIISRLSICRLIEIYIEKYGAFRRDMLKRNKVLELEPALGQNYLSFSNSIDRALIALGLNRKQLERVLTPAEIAIEIDREKEEAERHARENKASQTIDPQVISDSGQSSDENPEKKDGVND